MNGPMAMAAVITDFDCEEAENVYLQCIPCTKIDLEISDEDDLEVLEQFLLNNTFRSLQDLRIAYSGESDSGLPS